MAKHFTLQIADGRFDYQRNQAQIDQEALFDGIYVIGTDQPEHRIGSQAVVRAYKQLKVNERAFRTMKAPLEIRPIYHRLDARAHLPAPDDRDRAASQRVRPARHQAQVDRRQPARKRKNPAIPG